MDNIEIQEDSSQSKHSFAACLEKLKKAENNPDLWHRIEDILDISLNSSGEFKTADEVESKVVEAVQKLGNATIHGWAAQQHDRALEKAKKENPKGRVFKKKPSIGTQSSES